MHKKNHTYKTHNNLRHTLAYRVKIMQVCFCVQTFFISWRGLCENKKTSTKLLAKKNTLGNTLMYTHPTCLNVNNFEVANQYRETSISLLKLTLISWVT